MLGCSTVCPQCQHQFQCCPADACCSSRRSLHGLSGGGLVVLHGGTPHQPQPSPSVSLTFVIPPFGTQPLPAIGLPPSVDVEARQLADTARALRLCGWYYEGTTYEASIHLLKESPVGTFLVRDSADPRYLYSLSVQTERGPTSVRLHYDAGWFRLDAQPELRSRMPKYGSVIELLEHYVRETARRCASVTGDKHVWVDAEGKWYSAIALRRPLRRDDAPPRLAHLARLAVNAAIEPAKRRSCHASPHILEMPTSLAAYMSDYPYSI